MSTREDEPTYAYVVEAPYNAADAPHLVRSRILKETRKVVIVETYLRWRKRFKPADIHRSPTAAWHAYAEEQNIRIEEALLARDAAMTQLAYARDEIERIDNPTI